ncbi:STAS domain-containing protein [Schinkia azotoformans]|uniref:Anti-sigma factor antagonist n=1 Tax=Schinkia azotoformans LMG 9581 TaxID=1131731 RepID=K6DNN1_SCHAZ|nr:STAS domain-containing protein [Schinkia azotoformans]EKN62366.1 anti-sigma-factor antagonist [Schinkia azotoformans LMG 9581]MEC1639584.1 STAS domain-containing protein [Schinkia azotoformans]MEC1722389.1 STAS domain-containing protein [Schinkia azotoformans]MEC1947347.1 STAS domain-containing protein [Schinkia azotoformans]MED4350772.1 STAS domain-containing protein [Schinkia azotoformans]
MNLKIDIEESQNGRVVKLAGEVDVYTAPMLRDAIIPLTVENDSNLIVDMTKVSYMDSTGLGVFIGAFKSSHQYRSTLKLIGVTEKIERLFQITGLSEIIDIDTKPRGE